jgi:hypothetical protein
MSQAVDERTDALVLDVSVVGAGQAFPSSCSKALLASAIRGGVVYDSLVLFSPRSYSALPGLVMPGDPDGDPNKDHVADYLERYAERFGLPMALQERIVRLERRGDYFIGWTNRRRHVTGRAVIVATGALQRSVIPPWAISIAPDITQFGADAYRNPAQLRARRVLVVGGGGSLRDSSLWRHGVRLRPRTIAPTADGLSFADGSRATFDAVIRAVGYEDDAEWLRVPRTVDMHGNPIEDRGISPVPGLFYVGRSWQTSRASALLCGVGADAARIVARATSWLHYEIDPGNPNEGSKCHTFTGIPAERAVTFGQFRRRHRARRGCRGGPPGNDLLPALQSYA